VQFSILGEKQVILAKESITRDLFVMRGSKYSGRGTPHAISHMFNYMNPTLEINDGKVYPHTTEIKLTQPRKMETTKKAHPPSCLHHSN
jgi:hypothetical protein